MKLLFQQFLTWNVCAHADQRWQSWVNEIFLSLDLNFEILIMYLLTRLCHFGLNLKCVGDIL